MCRQLAREVLLVVGAVLLSAPVQAADPWVVYEGHDGPGKGKHVVLISGDEEYRTEEGFPQLGKILAKHHGTVRSMVTLLHDNGELRVEASDGLDTPATT